MSWGIALLAVVLLVVGAVWMRRSRPVERLIRDDDVDALEAALARQPDALSTLAARGAPPLIVAATAGSLGAARVLLAHGADPLARHPDGTTPIAAAAAFGHAAMIGLLHQAGGALDATDDLGVSALHHAVGAGHRRAVERLLDLGAETDLKDATGRTPLDLALGKQASPLVELLQAHGARPGAEFRMAEVLARLSPASRQAWVFPRSWGMRTDDPRLVAARQQARATLGHLDRAVAEQRTAVVKWSLDGDGTSEAVWGEVVGQGLDDDLIVSLLTPPAAMDGPTGPVVVPRAALHDWEVLLDDGTRLGGFTKRVTLEAMRDEFGSLPPEAEADLTALRTPEADSTASD